jgi:hypothetical protein
MRLWRWLALGLCWLALPAWADLAGGMQAYQRQDYAQAQQYFETAAAEGNEIAADFVRVIIDREPQQPRLARWLALERVDGGVMLNGRFGNLFFTPKASPAVRRGLPARAAAGDAVAQWMLAMMLHSGQGGPVDLPEAVRWYRAAAAQGNVPAMDNLGAIYQYGPVSLRDPAAGLALWQQAARADSFVSQYNLGVSYFLGDGVPRDVDQALYWWRLAAQNDWLFPMRALAETHAELREKDPYHARQAQLWYQRAAQQGNAAAQYELARIYRYGWGVARDERQMLSWYRQAALNKYEDAMKTLRELFHAGDHVAQDLPMAYALAVLMYADGDSIFYQQRIDSQMSEAQRTEARALAARVVDKAQLAAALAERLDKPVQP